VKAKPTMQNQRTTQQFKLDLKKNNKQQQKTIKNQGRDISFLVQLYSLNPNSYKRIRAGSEY
jgi:hypothetical protein